MTVSGHFTTKNFWIRINGKGISVRWKGLPPFSERNNYYEPAYKVGPVVIILLK